MTLSIPEAKDGYVNQQELSDGVQTTVGLPSDAKAGDTVTIYIKNETGELQGKATRLLKSDDIDKKSVDFDLDKNFFSPDGKYKVEATIKDPAENESKALDKSFIIDTKAPGSTPDAGKLEIQVLDSSITPQEFERDEGVLVKVKLPTDVVVGDKLTLTVQHKTILGANGSLDLVITQEHLNASASDARLIITLPMETFFKTEGARTDIPYDAVYGDYSVLGVIADVAGNALSSEGNNFELNRRKTNAELDGEQLIFAKDLNVSQSNEDWLIRGTADSNIYKTGRGNDWIFGGAGDDIIIGGSGRNTLTGGTGSDTFKYNLDSLGAIDTITDFKFGTASDKDVLYLKDLMASNFDKNKAEDLGKFFKFDKGAAGQLVLMIDHDGEGFANTPTTPHVKINFSNQQFDNFSYFAQDQTLANILSQLEQDGNIVV
jgi:hypothetical protein